MALFFFSVGNKDELRKYVNRMHELFTTSKNRTANAEIELRLGGKMRCVELARQRLNDLGV